MTGVPGDLPVPTPDRDSQPYWDGLAGGELRIQRCRACRRFQHFPAPICSTCSSFDLDFVPVSGRGTVESVVVIVHTTSPVFAARVPIAAAWIALPEQPGLRVFADVIGCPPEAVRIGMPVEVVLDADAFTPTERCPHPPPLPRFTPAGLAARPDALDEQETG